MAHRAIREFDGKLLLSRHVPQLLGTDALYEQRCVQINASTDLARITEEHPWLLTQRLVVKPDQLIKRRGVNNLILVNTSWDDGIAWINERMNTELTLDGITGVMHTFIIEPFLSHQQEDELYLCIRSLREGDEILFHHQGGVSVGDVDAKAKRLLVPTLGSVEILKIEAQLLSELPVERKGIVADFIQGLFLFYRNAHFAYLEINPLTFIDGKLAILDLAAKLDDTAEFECGDIWGEFNFPAPFGREATEEERYIRRLDAQSGSSLKFTLLNPEGRVWTMVAGGGASVVYTDTITDLGFGQELANYGEYSGNPTEEESYEYAKTVLDLMTRQADPNGKEKVLLIGGGIANFTDVAKTFSGIARAITNYSKRLQATNTKIFVRRGGPNCKEGLERMKNLGVSLGIPIEVFGPETHMTKIVGMALAN